MIPYGRQDIRDEDVAAVAAVLRSDWLTQGPALPRFEEAVAARCGARHAVAANSATSALHLACLALDLKLGERLWTTPNTFVASANCGRYCGAAVDFVDIGRDSLNLDPAALADKLEQADKAGKLPKVVVAVDFAGQSCNMAALRLLANRYGFRLIEDASHAIGGRYQGQPVGDGRHADITVFSFHPVKIITTGEGGMALCHDAELAARMARLRSHGIVRNAAAQAAEGPWYYEQVELGFNYRMTDMQAALGLSQLARLDDYVAARRRLADRYDRLLAGLPLQTPWRDPEAESAWHLYVIRLDDAVLARPGRRAVFEYLRAAGIGVNVHYIPVHLQPDYRRFGFAPGDFPVAEDYYARALTLPLYPGLSDAGQDRVVAALREALA
ncbi:UDP-4-amino-4,6-dideoxy-N-acetyl-beta-L-altrosamine transaminase [bacterium]|nr:UDP-4-amino-4,6-dideoxy-N-acetyl-beta-L-altrosamine transaminase [bacterium]PIV88915.1 MAG: UDP-4-amino-4,6-dideoxy-N-acetyl-beta-L-altrosamine transaminase [Hydrogenophilales bacterium CG17_big_fil_post_rev_8_21_14_2_50_63_12]PIX97104.1 MAG: UDP-4-amino-4,6-dideoxy-N-acetyl-beta-L-altrosamine transaminase [Hydrogenophilales bacterium CG_4_10_14_3_um_filter_63_21]